MPTRLLAILFLGMFHVLPVSAQQKEPDIRVKRMLEKLKYKYETTSSGNFKAIFNTENGRSQLLNINSNVYKHLEVEFRELWSPVYLGDAPPSASDMLTLLTINSKRKFGAFEVNELEENGSVKYLICFSAKINANADSNTYESAIKMVIETADQTEKELFNSDKY
jgi:hypothetical protein